MQAFQMPDQLPRFFIRRRGHGAGIDDIGVRCLLGGDQLVAHGAKQLFHGLTFKLIGFAAERTNGDFQVFRPISEIKYFSSKRLQIRFGYGKI